MALSSELVSQYAKLTVNNNKKQTPRESTVYGTTVIYEGKTYVKLDGSDLLTPVQTTSATSDGDRVSVSIKNHAATITGNLSDPSASSTIVQEQGTKISEFDIIVADKVTVKELDAVNGRIDNLVSDNVVITGKLDANEALIKDLTADNVVIKDSLTAQNATIENLKTTKLDANVADIKYATIESLDAINADIYNLNATYGEFEDLVADRFEAVEATIKSLEVGDLSAQYADIEFANIGEAAIGNFLAKSGMIDDLIVSDGHVTGELVGVKIRGDLIIAETIQADKLVVKGEDGLYYRLNVEGGATVSERVSEEDLQNGLDGTIIIAQSVTADKVYVDDLYAFDATIGGFKITDHSLYSGVKESVNNTTTGVYLDKEGQINFGNARDFVKFYKTTNEEGTDEHRLEIAASEFRMSATGKTIEQEMVKMTTDSRTSIVEDCEQIILGAMKNYTKTGDFETFRQTTEATLKLLSDEMTLKFTETTNQIASVNSDLQDKFNTITKYFTFDINGLTIGQIDNPNKVVLDNDVITILVNGIEVIKFDSNGKALVSEIVILRRANIFGLDIDETDTNINSIYTGITIPIEILEQPKSVSIKNGENAVFTTRAKGNDISYQWQEYMNNNWVNTPYDVGKTNTLVLYRPAISAGRQFRCLVTDRHGNTLATNTVVLNVSVT